MSSPLDSTVYLLISRRAEAFDLDDLDVAAFEVHDRYELLNEWDLETGLTALHDQASLRWTKYHICDRPTVGADFEAD